MRVFSIIGILAVLPALALAGFFFGGFYNVAANDHHTPPVLWALERVRNAAISRAAMDQPPPETRDPTFIETGARAYANRGCITCHGAPGTEWAKFSEAMYPDPPDLTEVAKLRSMSEIFWVVKNGLKMTAMPSFGSIGVDDKELWSIAAFVKKLPDVREDEYKAWIAPPAQ